MQIKDNDYLPLSVIIHIFLKKVVKVIQFMDADNMCDLIGRQRKWRTSIMIV